MDGSAPNIAESDEWEVRLPSQEYRNLPGKVRKDIDEFLSECPVKLGSIANRLGIRVLLSTLPRGISGQIVQENDQFVIRINRHEARHRQRFTLAHEIAHYLLHKDRIIADGGWSENLLLRSGQPKEIEYEANRLASDIIVPSDLLIRATEGHTGSMTDEVIEDLAHRFRVSAVTIEIRLQIT